MGHGRAKFYELHNVLKALLIKIRNSSEMSGYVSKTYRGVKLSPKDD
jgi:hypothetical protein